MKSTRSHDGFVTINNERFYKISHSDQIPPFFMNIVSDSDFWLFMTSTAGITAGRTNAQKAIFPYTTTDKLNDSIGSTGPLTITRFPSKRKKPLLWSPLSPNKDNHFDLERNIYKNVVGNKVIFEETNSSLGLTFRSAFTTADSLGLVRETELINTSRKSVKLEILDGFLNILPAGMNLRIQTESSVLGDAYKWTEKIDKTSLAVYIMNSALTDRAEPKESLKATVAWSAGLDGQILLSASQIMEFQNGGKPISEKLSKGVRGAYLLFAPLTIRPSERISWHIITDTDLTQSQVAQLRDKILAKEFSCDAIKRLCDDSAENLKRILSGADALQKTGKEISTAHHFANVLFNCMRGGVFMNQYRIDKADFIRFAEHRNKPSISDNLSWVKSLPSELTRDQLVQSASQSGDDNLFRLSLEYLPLAFSRRHGDPSRPWNKFNIRLRDEQGGMLLNYEGNWRDIFQNWESLFLSFPRFLENAVAKFVNAMTVDGYNPYRISRDGIDWEKIEPDDPWAFIGYWGDHQVIYLLRLLEWLEKFEPGKIRSLLPIKIFSYANVPYRIKSYQEILKDPHDTILFDHALDKAIMERVSCLGTDGRLVLGVDGKVLHVTLAEKLLLILLAKMVNFVPGGGIWMNTQRPEWNDANNALAGYGVSMVTLFYLRRYSAFLLNLCGDIEIPSAMADLVGSIEETLEMSHNDIRKTCENNSLRKRVMDGLNKAGELFRNRAYNGERGPEVKISSSKIKSFLQTCLDWMDMTISANERHDGLYHSYNLLHIEKESISLSPLAPMLEGQVSALASGILKPEKALLLLKALRQSDLYRKDQNSYLLYPIKDHPPYLQRNIIPQSEITKSQILFKDYQSSNAGLILKDPDGTARFIPEADNAKSLSSLLDRLAQKKGFSELVAKEKSLILQIYEKVFNHHSFTGRSGSMFSYEGIGCIYWHMVAKLVLAAEEATLLAEGALQSRLKEASQKLAEGLGYRKDARTYGAFPTDPYSHTPLHAGAQQPGMTGQVKEEILIRWTELGIRIAEGRIGFKPTLLDPSELMTQEDSFVFYDLNNQKSEITLGKNELCFTFCQIPIIYRKSKERAIEVYWTDSSKKRFTDSWLDRETSQEIFQRSGKVKEIRVYLTL
jgi:hypothetical protein